MSATADTGAVDPGDRTFGYFVERPGVAPAIAANGWTCAAEGCGRTPAVGVSWWKEGRGHPWLVRQAACEKHAAEFEARYCSPESTDDEPTCAPTPEEKPQP